MQAIKQPSLPLPLRVAGLEALISHVSCFTTKMALAVIVALPPVLGADAPLSLLAAHCSGRLCRCVGITGVDPSLKPTILSAIQQLCSTLLVIMGQREDLHATQAAHAALAALDFEHTAQLAPAILAAIGAAMHRVTAKATSEAYLLALFGCLGVMLECVGPGDLDSIAKVEGLILPAVRALCEDLEANDPLGLNHHLYSTLAVLLQRRGQNSNLPGEYREVLLFALRPAPWQYNTHVPALVDLLQVYFETVPTEMCTQEVGLLLISADDEIGL